MNFSKTNTILEEELSISNPEEFAKKLIEHEENFHNGKTFKYENDLEDIRYYQYKTVITIIEKDDFIYEEIIKINDKPVLVLGLHNDEKREILKLIIFLEKDNVVQQISRLSYDEFLQMVKNKEQWIKTEETNNVTLIKTPLSDFIENINIKQEKLKLTIDILVQH
ncbi:hypothetical protein [Spiroplasma endosymbiont of Nebria brevicollis]|uniref:hypothetical protein n=1 Tax=Spiroplasma endosymbiont of Nebria brevicollis TaxID=3066284 RepID=UPI00313E5C99